MAPLARRRRRGGIGPLPRHIIPRGRPGRLRLGSGGRLGVRRGLGCGPGLGLGLRRCLRGGLGLRLDNDRDGDVDAMDIRLVTEQQARILYVEDFYIEPRIHLLPYALRHFHMDFAINSGPGRAIIELQETINNLRLGASPLVPDGRIGPRTIAALNSAVQQHGLDHVLTALVNNRLYYVRGIVQRDPTQAKFLRGWINRIETFRPKR